ncbi:four-carbon acid sugar kinase family protein [Phyllobacterium sp. K27]
MLTILADDLTGALDTAAPFSVRGMHVEVALTVEAIGEALQKAPDVLSINLGSRDVSSGIAHLQTVAAIAALPAGTRLFKKIDSRLKGHIEAELDAMPFQLALVVPAIPAFGRIVKDGCVTGFGLETPIPVAGKLGRYAALATIPDISSHSEMLDWLDRAQCGGVDLLIGARGLAEALAERISGGAATQAPAMPGGPTLFVIGSRDPITLAQIDELRAHTDPRYLPAPNGRLADIEFDGSAITLVQAVSGAEVLTSADVSHALAESVCPNLTQNASILFLSGGATAEAVLKTMGIVRFRLLGECLPGLGLAHAQGHCIIAKSGGFGQPDTLKEVADRILRNMG